jgi:hypothetical protein
VLGWDVGGVSGASEIDQRGRRVEVFEAMCFGSRGALFVFDVGGGERNEGRERNKNARKKRRRTMSAAISMRRIVNMSE